MVDDHQDNGLAISTPDPRAVTGKNACAAPVGQVGASSVFIVANKAQDSAPPYSNNPRPSIDGLPCAIPPGAQLTGGGISNRSQSFSLQSGHALSHKLASSFPSHSQIASSGVTP
jgi:hypothetical protein